MWTGKRIRRKRELDLASRYPECYQKCSFCVRDSNLDQQLSRRTFITLFCLLDPITAHVPHFFLQPVLNEWTKFFCGQHLKSETQIQLHCIPWELNHFQKLELLIHVIQHKCEKILIPFQTLTKNHHMVAPSHCVLQRNRARTVSQSI